MTFDPATRELANETRGRTYTPVPLTPKEDEIRRTGVSEAADESLQIWGYALGVARE